MAIILGSLSRHLYRHKFGAKGCVYSLCICVYVIPYSLGKKRVAYRERRHACICKKTVRECS